MIRKPIRFNLQFYNGKESVPIRNLDDLTENMNIDDLVDSFLSGDLERWLRTLNETERADKVSKLDHNDKEKTLLNLFHALNLEFPESDVKETVVRYLHQKAMAQARAAISNSSPDAKQPSHVSKTTESAQIRVFNESRLNDYKQLKERLNYLNSQKLSSYKSLVSKLTNDYPDYLELDSAGLIRKVKRGNSPLVLLNLLMNPKWNPVFSSYARGSFFVGYSKPNANLFFIEENISYLLDEMNVVQDNPEKPVKWIDIRYKHVSFNFWQKIVPEDKKVIVIHCGANIDIKPGDYSGSEEKPTVTKFGIINGLQCLHSGLRNSHTENILVFMVF